MGTSTGCGRLDPIRVALIDMPRMLNQLVEEAVTRSPKLALVANVHEPSALRAEHAPAFVVAGGDGIDDTGIARVLADLPLARVLVIRDDGRSAYLFSRALGGVPLGELSPEDLVALICSSDGRAAR